MTKKKKKKRRDPIFLKFWFPVGMGSGRPGMHNAFLIEAKHFQRGLDVLHKKVMPDQSKKSLDHVAYNLRDGMRSPYVNAQSWLSFILMAETLGLTPAKMFGMIGKHHSKKELQKLRVGFLNQLKVKQLLRKINKWGGVPAAWKDQKKYIDVWCRKTGTPIFKTLKDFQTYISAWREATVGKRKWSSSGISTKGDKPFSVLNPPPKS